MGRAQTLKQVYSILHDKKILLQHVRDLTAIYSAIPMKFKEDVVNELWSASQLPGLGEYLEEYKPYLSTHQIEELLSAGFTIGAIPLTIQDVLIYLFRN